MPDYTRDFILALSINQTSLDKAFLLKQQHDAGHISDLNEARKYLDNSELVKELLADFELNVLNLLHRLTELAEIPWTCKLEKVQTWLSQLVKMSWCGDGFSITGKSNDILSCYNSMITSVLLRMQYPEKECVTKGIRWILDYQNVERGQKTNWNGPGILKYGGCMKATPCYIGVVKAMIALSDYKHSDHYQQNDQLEQKLSTGLEYILSHSIFKRRSKDEPVTKDIMKLTYPFTYKTNIIEILRLIMDNNLHTDPRCLPAKEYLGSKRQKNGYWKVNSSYLPKSWVVFDRLGEPGVWISHEIEKLVADE